MGKREQQKYTGFYGVILLCRDWSALSSRGRNRFIVNTGVILVSQF